MLSRGEESCGEVGLNSGFSGFFMVGEDMSAGNEHKHKVKKCVKEFVYDTQLNINHNLNEGSVQTKH